MDIKAILTCTLVLFILSTEAQTDNQLHLMAGTTITFAQTQLLYSLKIEKKKCIKIGFITGCTIGVGKELYDVYNGNKFDIKDLGCTIAGCALSSVITNLLYRKKLAKY